MGVHDPEQDDDLQIEISPLHPPVTPTATSMESATARSLFAPARSRLLQRRRGIVVTGMLVVVMATLVLSITPTREALRGIVLGPTPTMTQPVPVGEDNLYIVLSPRWGAVTLDDKPLSHLPVEGIDQPLHLARGGHILRWRFAPIIDISCRLTVPSALGDTCPLRVGILPGKKGIASVVSLQLSLSSLTPAYRITLLAAIRAALETRQSSEIVRVGERYVDLTRSGAPVVATQPLRATLSFISDAENPQAQCVAIDSGPGANCAMNGDCRELCTAPWQTPPTSWGGAWQAYIVAHASWRYTTLDGRVVADDQPDIGGELQFLGANAFPVPVAIGWDGSTWKVQVNIGTKDSSAPWPDLVCASAWADVQNSFVAPPDPGVWQASTLAYIPGASAASGCLLVMTAAGQPPLLVLHRFGIALAVNDSTEHQLCCPMLPVADAYEQQLAQRILATQQGR